MNNTSRKYFLLSLFCLLVMAVIFLTSCGNNANGSERRLKSDTSVQLGIYLNYGLKNILWGPVREITTYDSVVFANGKDTIRKDVRWYYVECVIPVDSAVAKIFQVPLLDSTGRRYSISRVFPSEEKYVRTRVEDFNVAVSYLSQFIAKPDSTKK
jgi:hypothetical protein